MNTSIGIFCLALLILIHELGHFLVAKALSMPVTEFAIGFGPKLLSWTPRGRNLRENDVITTYSLRLIPLGGFVSLQGEESSNQDTSETQIYENIIDVSEETELVTVEKTEVATDTLDLFRERPAWQKISVFVAGPFANLLFGYIFFYISCLLQSDPFLTTVFDVFQKTNSAIIAFLTLLGTALLQLCTGITTHLGGPITIVASLSEASQNSFAELSLLLGIISLQLGFLNLLPLPILDGGQIVKVVLERAIQRTFSKQLSAMLNYASIAMLFTLMIFALYQDFQHYAPF